MVKPKTEEEIELMRENAILVSKTLAEVGRHVAPGVTTLELNRVAETFIRDHGAIPSFLGYEGFPGARFSFGLCPEGRRYRLGGLRYVV